MVALLDARHPPHKIHLAGIDAPEKARAFGNKSKQSLSDLCYGKTATLADKEKPPRANVGLVTVEGFGVSGCARP